MIYHGLVIFTDSTMVNQHETSIRGIFTIYLHGCLIFMVIHVGKYTIVPWMVWDIIGASNGNIGGWVCRQKHTKTRILGWGPWKGLLREL